MSSEINPKFPKFSLSLLLCFLFLPGTASGQNGVEVLLKEMRWRNIGPANFSGRIVDVEALDRDFRHVIVASASGGVWKSKNAGTTWKPIFENYGSASIGDVAIFQRKPEILRVGTGEAGGRWKDLAQACQRPPQRRQDRGNRRCNGPPRSRHPLCGVLPTTPSTLAFRQRRSEWRDFQEYKWRKELEETISRSPAGRHRANRPGHLPEKSQDPHGHH